MSQEIEGRGQPRANARTRLIPGDVDKAREEMQQITQVYNTNKPFKRISADKLQLYEPAALGLKTGQYLKMEFVGVSQDRQLIMMMFRVVNGDMV